MIEDPRNTFSCKHFHQHTMFFGGTGVRWRECDVIGRICHRSSINKTFLHSTKDSRNLRWQAKTAHRTHGRKL